MPDTRRTQIATAAARELRQAVREDDDTPTHRYRAVADLLVELRGLHTGTDGLPDWRGTSYAYRSAVSRIYADAGLSPEASHSVKAALRYHIGNALRDHLSEDELEAAGLDAANPRDRQHARHRGDKVPSPSSERDRLLSTALMTAKRLSASTGRATQRDVERAREAAALLTAWADGKPVTG